MSLRIRALKRARPKIPAKHSTDTESPAPVDPVPTAPKSAEVTTTPVTPQNAVDKLKLGRKRIGRPKPNVHVKKEKIATEKLITDSASPSLSPIKVYSKLKLEDTVEEEEVEEECVPVEEYLRRQQLVNEEKSVKVEVEVEPVAPEDPDPSVLHVTSFSKSLSTVVDLDNDLDPGLAGDNEDSDREEEVSVSSKEQKPVTIDFNKTRRVVPKPRVKPAFGPEHHLDRSKMKMRDLIYWNPLHQPATKWRQERAAARQKMAATSSSASAELEEDEKTVPVAPKCEDNVDLTPKTEVKTEKEKDVKELIAPQVSLDAYGNIVLNEESLVLRDEPVQAVEEVHEGWNDLRATYTSFRASTARSRFWSDQETTRFYKALSTIGTDFSFMASVFRGRTREELKRKFKREEKKNPHLVDRVLKARRRYDLSIYDDYSDVEAAPEQVDSSDDDTLPPASYSVLEDVRLSRKGRTRRTVKKVLVDAVERRDKLDEKKVEVKVETRQTQSRIVTFKRKIVSESGVPEGKGYRRLTDEECRRLQPPAKVARVDVKKEVLDTHDVDMDSDALSDNYRPAITCVRLLDRVLQKSDSAAQRLEKTFEAVLAEEPSTSVPAEVPS